MSVKIKNTSCTTRSDKEHFVLENLVEKKLFVKFALNIGIQTMFLYYILSLSLRYMVRYILINLLWVQSVKVYWRLVAWHSN